ncbi:MAG: DUF3866 family protein [Coriobacteriia bacterium]|jgi:hypothetical protein|nr:DUF3866 family protein [Coriobacteriia bacterium]MDR2714207.1 DUF3866 family protein [Coriobacteriales bacterium]
MRLCWGTVLEVINETEARQKLRVSLIVEGEPAGRGKQETGSECVALNYLNLAPSLTVGDRALLNVVALDLELGTGGCAFVVPSEAFEQPNKDGYGHIIKLRYTPLQREAATIEEQDSPHHATLQEAHSLDALPVVCCGLASQVPLVAAAIKAILPNATVAFCMTDEASLMFEFSELFCAARKAGLIDVAISCGQALGADAEAITLHSGLLAARHVYQADVCITSIGPGVPGSDTPYGHGGIAQGEALNAVVALGGVPLAPLRLSFADARVRHRGVSHHTLTVLERICLGRVNVPLPENLSAEQTEQVEQALQSAGLYDRHAITPVSFDEANIDLRGLTVTTMGRTQKDDPAFFAASFAAGALAASFAQQNLNQPSTP